MRLRDLLEGETPSAQQALDRFFRGIEDERILWYPSAGRDYRDIMEMSEQRRTQHDIRIAPNIFCHTDYMHDWTGLDEHAPIVMHQNKHTLVTVVEKHPLRLTLGNQIHTQIDHDDFRYPKKAGNPLIFFLRVKIRCDLLGEIDAHVFYFLFENYHFLEELVLKKRLAVTHLIKVRQGCGFGGCKKCISVIYSLLANIGIRYMMIDEEIWYHTPTHHRLARRNRIRHKNYSLQRIGMPVLQWSGYRVLTFRIEPLPGLLSNEHLNQMLASINRGWFGDHHAEPWQPLSLIPVENIKHNHTHNMI